MALYQASASMLESSRKSETHRNTVVAHLCRAGVEIRPQKEMTPELVAQATALYGSGHSLAEIASSARTGTIGMATGGEPKLRPRSRSPRTGRIGQGGWKPNPEDDCFGLDRLVIVD